MKKRTRRAYGRSRILSLAVCVAAVLSPLLMTGAVGYWNDLDNVYSHKANAEMKIALTFDDGPHETQTARILDVLERCHVPATFFVVGNCAIRHPEIIRRILGEGHEIGNHTYSHLLLYTNSVGRMAEELTMTEEVIYEISEYRTRLFRPPGGLCSQKIADYAANCDYVVILWNVDTRDWAHTSTREIVDMVVKNTESGDIILFHDGISGENNTVEALQEIIPKLREKGFRFVTVSELIGSK